MKISLNIENDFIHFRNLEFDFSKTGTYFIMGDNGIGKTSLMKEMVFGNNKITFRDKELEKAYKRQKSQVISYVGQDPEPDSKTVKEYVYQYNKVFNYEMFLMLIKEFGLEELDMEFPVDKLSGGDLVKLSIISSLIKETPFIFLDEPSNNLDNESVRALVRVINMFSHDRTFIIITHDPRLCIEDAEIIEVKKNGLEVKYSIEKQEVVTRIKPCEIDIPKVQIGRMHLKDRFVRVSGVLIFSILLCISFLNSQIIARLYSQEELPNKNNSILTYMADGSFGEMNQQYARNEDIYVEKENYNNFLTFDALNKISSDKNVSKIILTDNKYLWELNESIYDETLLQKKYILSIPYDIAINYGDMLEIGYDVRYVKSGRLPYDKANEVVVSENVLKEFYGYTESNISTAIGDKITVNNSSYEIVGISYVDLLLISYDNKSNYGFFEFDKDTSKKKIEEIMQYLSIKEATVPTAPSNVVIYTHESREKDVLKQLILSCPATNYYSYEFAYSYKTNYNSRINHILWLANIVLSVIFMFLLFMLYRKQRILYSVEMRNTNNYYIRKNLCQFIYITSRGIQYIAIVLVIVAISLSVFKYADLILKYMLLDILIIGFPLFVVYGKK